MSVTQRPRVTHVWTETTATIRIGGLRDPVRMLQLADSHLSLIDERDAEYLETHASYYERFGTRRFREDGSPVPTEESFAEAIGTIADQPVDLLALTGDILQFPSQANLECTTEALAPLDCAKMYTAGNHDWWYQTTPGNAEIRQAWWPTLEPLHRGNPSHASCDVGGLRFITVDNSTYQIEPAQLEFVQRKMATNRPIVLLMHIPLSLPTLRPDTLSRWELPILMGDPDWPLAQRAEWMAGPDLPSTAAFIELLAAAPNLVAVFCGHLHFPHVDSLSPTAVQYVVAPGFAGGYRRVDFMPLESVHD